MAVRGFLCRDLAMMSWSGTLASPRWVAGAVPELVELQAGVVVQQHAAAVIAEAGPAGVRADVAGRWPAGRDGFASGQEQRSARTRSAAGQAQLAREQVGGAGVPVHPLDRAAFGTGWAPGGCPGRGPARRSRGSPPRGPRSRTAS